MFRRAETLAILPDKPCGMALMDGEFRISIIL
jgi:hypothetical protein